MPKRWFGGGIERRLHPPGSRASRDINRRDRELTEFVLRRAAADIARLRKWHADPDRRQLSLRPISQYEFHRRGQEVIRKSGIDAASLTLEVTESAIISSPTTAIAVLTACATTGRIAMDDYGPGNRRYLIKELPSTSSRSTSRS